MQPGSCNYCFMCLIHFIWDNAFQLEADLTKGIRRNRFVYTVGLAACGLLDFCLKKKKKALCEVVSKVLPSRFRKLVFFTIEKCGIYSSLFSPLCVSSSQHIVKGKLETSIKNNWSWGKKSEQIKLLVFHFHAKRPRRTLHKKSQRILFKHKTSQEFRASVLEFSR